MKKFFKSAFSEVKKVPLSVWPLAIILPLGYPILFAYLVKKIKEASKENKSE